MVAMENSLITTIEFVLLCSSFAFATAKSPTVIIIGAGMSRISAAKRLSDEGVKNILILEATNKIGGRIEKTNFGGLSVEMGANWVEGVGGSETNPIWEMAKTLKLNTLYSDYDNLTSNIYKQVGGLQDQSVAKKAMDLADELHEFSKNVLKKLSAHKQEDISILALQRLKN